METDGEAVCLVVTNYSNYNVKPRKTSIDKRDYDSLNNLVFLESDTESTQSIPTDGKAECTTNHTGNMLRSQSTGDHCRRDSGKLMFKDELSKHKSLVRRDMMDGTRDTNRNYKHNSRRSIWRSFICLCTGLLFAFMSFMPLRNIQTSLYPRNHLANVSLVCMYIFFAVGCLVSSWITQNARPKGVILIAIFGHVLYCAANIYPSMYTLIPSACFFGFFHAPMWSAQELMLASYGASYTAVTPITIDKAVQQFQSVFLVFCHAAQIFGNLLESVILHCGDTVTPTGNASHHSQAEYQTYTHLTFMNYTADGDTKELVGMGPFGYRIEPDTIYPYHYTNYENVLKCVFLALAAIGMATICLFLNKPDIIIQKKKSTLTEKLRDVGSFMTTGVFYLLFLLMLFSGMQQAVVIANVTKMYGTLTLGIHMVGFMMMVYGTAQLATLLVVEKLQARLKPIVAILNAFLVSLGLLVWLYIWEPAPGATFKVLGYIGLWGAVDALWQSQVQGVLLSSAVGRKEAAVVVFRTVQSLGLVLLFMLDIWLSLLTQICVCGAILVFGVIFYMILEVIRSPVTSSEPSPYAL